jgi:hypothetical protein
MEGFFKIDETLQYRITIVYINDQIAQMVVPFAGLKKIQDNLFKNQNAWKSYEIVPN